MIDRRDFLRRSAGLISLACCPRTGKACVKHKDLTTAPPWAAEYEQILRSSRWLKIIGIPQNWNLVRLGLYPFAPERVAILKPSFRIDNVRRQQVLDKCAQWSEHFWNQLPSSIRNECRSRSTRDRGWLTISTETLEVILGITRCLKDYYGCRVDFDGWASGLALREDECFYEEPLFSLGSSSTSTLSRWPDVPARLAQPFVSCFRETYVPSAEPIDWWAFVFPGGVKWYGLSSQTLHMTLGLVSASGLVPIGPSQCELEATTFLPVLLRQLTPKLRYMSGLNQLTLARMLNRNLGSYLRRLRTE